MRSLVVSSGFLAMAACAQSEAPPDAHEAEAEQAVTSIGAVLMQHNDMQRTGLNPNESYLNSSTLYTNFGKIRDFPTAGYVYAQPLFVPGVVIGGVAHDVVYVADEQDHLYAYEANTGAQLWLYTAGTPGTAADLFHSPASSYDPVNGGSVGITGTPVIDPSTSTIYFVALSDPSGRASVTQKIIALDLATGALKASHTISVTANGIAFDPLRQLQRAGLLLWSGQVFVGWGGVNADSIDYDPGNPNVARPWHGWVMGFNATTLAAGGAWVSTATASPCCSTHAQYGGGVWMAGSGLACDGSHIFIGVGEGNWWAPTDPMLASNDEDMTGVMILPETNVGGHASTLATANKLGSLYILDRTSLGHFGAPVSEVDGKIGHDTNATKQNFYGLPAHFNGKLYYAGNADKMKVFTVGAGGLGATPTMTGTDTYGYAGAVPSISASGTSNPIVWSVQRTPGTSPYVYPATGTLLAYDASTLSTLYSSNTVGENPTGPVQFVPPTIAGGKVFVAGQHVSEYGAILTVSVPSVTVHRGGYSSSFTLSTTRATSPQYSMTAGFTPSGLYATFSPQVFNAGASSVVQFYANTTATTGTFTIPLLATETANPTRQHTVTVQVTILP